MFQKKNGLVLLILLALTGIANNIYAEAYKLPAGNNNRRAQQRTTAARCLPAVAAIDLDINNVRARLMTGGDMWWNRGTAIAAYEVPKGSGKHSQFAASVWIGGRDEQNQLKVAAQTYRQDGNDYWPGILNETGDITDAECSDWDKFWKVDKSTINAFIELTKSGATPTGSQFDVIYQWPAAGNSKVLGASGVPLRLYAGRTYAPFVDLNNNGIYEPENTGANEYPLINGDQYIWWVFNDKGNNKEQTQTAAIGLEVQTSAFAYSSQDFLNNSTFCNYRVINRGSLALDSTYIAVWDDADLGYAFDDFIGCDTNRGLGILYNGRSVDGSGQINSYGSSIPQAGLDFFQGPKKKVGDSTITLSMTNFTYYNNDFSTIGNPRNGIHIYNYMTGSTIDNSRFSNDFAGPGIVTKGYGRGPISHFVYWGDPSDNSEWSECACGNVPGDRRMVFSAGPFELLPGATNDITFGAIWASSVGGCPQTSFKALTAIDDQAQALFDNGFKTIEGPEAPNLMYRELDRQLVFYLVNDSNSNNYKEQYGYNISDAKYRQPALKASRLLRLPDSLYKFQGYRVFQLADASVTPAQIYGTDGRVDQTKAIEVFQCDIRDSITRVINYVKNTEVSDSTWIPQIKVIGKDSGIVHSFQISQDAFATGADPRLVNYKNYYFVAIAYAYNDFSYNKFSRSGGFDPKRADSTQETPYLESAHGAAGAPLKVVAAMPNPANGNMGTELNAAYGGGVVITRLAGTGNGGNALQLDETSELIALTDTSHIAKQATYDTGAGPITVKVIDPVKVVASDWELRILGSSTTGATDQGLIAGGASWVLEGKQAGPGGTPVTIYSERNLEITNEQILAEYGLSVSIRQVKRPGDEQSNGNGYITSSVEFKDLARPWLTGVHDQADSNQLNWIRSGNNTKFGSVPCNFNDVKYDTMQAYANLLNNNSLTTSTWAPHALAAPFLYSGGAANSSLCGFSVAYPNSNIALYSLPSIDVVFTSDRSKWTYSAVLEMQEDPALAQGGAAKFTLRQHPSLKKDADASGNPVYEPAAQPGDPADVAFNDSGMSWFPGYAINQETGERLNIVFGEDSWMKRENGADMMWNPTSTILSTYDGSVVFGGKHYVYVVGSRYDSCRNFRTIISNPSVFTRLGAFRSIQWVGVPLVNPSIGLLPFAQGVIPTETRLRFRVTRPYAFYNTEVTPAQATVIPSDVSGIVNGGNPAYFFTTRGLEPTPLSDATNRNALLDRIHAVPNPYYGYAGYEANRFDTRVRIINLPARATVHIYSLDGTLIRTLSKSDPNVSYIDWDIRNLVGLPVASGMYLMHVNAEGIGETIVRWFGAMRPIDITTY